MMANESENVNNSEESETEQAASSKTVKYKMSETEKQLHESVAAGSVEDARRLLAEGVRVDCQDEHGMTPLQHAAYKGNEQLCQLFLSHGGDVNDISHEHGYTALMFGALSGRKEVVKLLLEHGACVEFENSVHKTASQMAAFVGQHEIVSLINNFFSRQDLEFYCVPRGLETEPKLPPELAPSLYKFILNVNLNPVKLCLVLRQTRELLDNADRVSRVLDTLCEKMMKQRNTNEILAMKFCYLSYVLKQAAKARSEESKSDDGSVLASWIKSLLKVDGDGLLVNQERLVRSMLSEFPYIECQLMQQMVRSITSSIAGLSAVNVLTSCINGQRFGNPDDKMCVTCGEFNGKMCQVCRSACYCDKQCQKLHWFIHKKECKQLAQQCEQQRTLEGQRSPVTKDSEGHRLTEQSEEVGQGERSQAAEDTTV